MEEEIRDEGIALSGRTRLWRSADGRDCERNGREWRNGGGKKLEDRCEGRVNREGLEGRSCWQIKSRGRVMTWRKDTIKRGKSHSSKNVEKV